MECGLLINLELSFFRRLLNPKRVSPAFSRVPYPSAKHMVQEQRRRQQNSMSGAFLLSKRGSRGARGTRGSGRGRGGGGGLVRQQHLRTSRPRGRPPSSSIKRNLVHRSTPLFSSPRQRLSDEEDEEVAEEVEDDVANRPASPTSSSPRTDVTEPGATSPWFYSARSPAGEPRGHNYGSADANKKCSLRKDYQHQPVRQRRPSKMHSPRRSRRRSSMDTSSGPAVSPIRSPGADSVFSESKEEPKPLLPTMLKVKRVRKMSGRLPNGTDVSPRASEKIGSSASKRTRRQSDLEASDRPGEQGNGEDQTKVQKAPSRSSVS